MQFCMAKVHHIFIVNFSSRLIFRMIKGLSADEKVICRHLIMGFLLDSVTDL